MIGPRGAAQIFGEARQAHSGGKARQGTSPHVLGMNTRSTPALASFSDIAGLVARIAREVLRGPNWDGLTKMEATTRLPWPLATAISDRCPAWSAPMVGTSAIVSPACRHLATCALKSVTVRTVAIVVSHDILPTLPKGS